jgi:hypothetical protein
MWNAYSTNSPAAKEHFFLSRMPTVTKYFI